MTAALSLQAEKLVHVSNYYYEMCIRDRCSTFARTTLARSSSSWNNRKGCLAMPSPHHAEMTFDDLPTLQDAFRTCDRDLLVRVVMADQVQGSFPAETVGKKQRHAMEKRILTSLDAMCSLRCV